MCSLSSPPKTPDAKVRADVPQTIRLAPINRPTLELTAASDSGRKQGLLAPHPLSASAGQLVQGFEVSIRHKKLIVATSGRSIGKQVADSARARATKPLSASRQEMRFDELVKLFKMAFEQNDDQDGVEKITCPWIELFLKALDEGLEDTICNDLLGTCRTGLANPLEKLLQQAQDAKSRLKSDVEEQRDAAERATSKRKREKMLEVTEEYGQLVDFAPHEVPCANDFLASAIFGQAAFDENGEIMPDSDAEDEDDSQWNIKRRTYIKTKSRLQLKQPERLLLRGRRPNEVVGKALVVYYDADGTGADVGFDATVTTYDDQGLWVLGTSGEYRGQQFLVELSNDEWHWKSCPLCNQCTLSKSFGCTNACCTLPLDC